jgi:signal transduction histidine kinase
VTTPPPAAPITRSLSFRLLAATLVALLLALLLAGLLLAGLFRDHVLRQYGSTLTAQLDQVTARLEFDAAGRPQLDPATLTDPRWSRPYAGLYWQVDGRSAAGQRGVLRSRSLWDAELLAPADTLADGSVHLHEVAGPGGTRVLLAERTVRRDDAAGSPWRLLVAGDLRETDAAIGRFNGRLAASLAGLALLLCAAAIAQVAVGLAPLRALQRALAAVHGGQQARLEGRFPSEVQPLIDDFNAVLERNAEVVARARTQAGNLAHAIKTPLAALDQAAQAAQAADPTSPRPGTSAELAALVREQVAVARRHVDWHLARSRAAAAQGLPGARAEIAPLVAGLLRVMARLHAERDLAFESTPVDPGCAFAGEAQDLQEMLGNLLDNACKWARQNVSVAATTVASPSGPRLQIVVQDDGPGIATHRRHAVMARGTRLDESVPGSGLGLAIVQELAGLYGGQVTLDHAASGGLRVLLDLPAATDAVRPPGSG